MARGSDAAKARLWRERFERFEDGGMTVADFCSSEGTSTASFYAWRRKLATQHQTKPDRTPRQKKKRKKKREEPQVAGRGAFEPVTIAAAAVVIRLPDGTRIELPANSEDALRTIVGQLVRGDVEPARC